MPRRKPDLSTVVAFMSEQAQDRVRARAEGELWLPVEGVRPDPDQPRQLLPDDIESKLVKGEYSPVDALVTWLGRADGAGEASTLAHDVRELRRLADSIARHGLIQPISVRPVEEEARFPDQVEYVIITGERRFWAHVLLVAERRSIQEGVETREADMIRAVMPAAGISIRAHQLIENLLRENIDAVEKARGFVALRQELSEGGNHGSRSQVPWRDVEETLGISDRYRKYITAVLNLSPEAQELISEHGISERTIRPVSQKLRDHPELQLRTINQLIAWQQAESEDDGPGRSITSAVKQYVDELLIAGTSEGNHGSPRKKSKQEGATVPVFRRQVKSFMKVVGTLDENEWKQLTEALATNDQLADTLDTLRSLQRSLDQLLKDVRQRQFD